MILYGIKNCDTTRKAIKWLTLQKYPFTFFDFKEKKPEKNLLEVWCKKIGWQNILNKKSLSWRNLTSKQKECITKKKALDLMLTNPLLIKRPIIVHSEILLCGFNLDIWQQHISNE